MDRSIEMNQLASSFIISVYFHDGAARLVVCFEASCGEMTISPARLGLSLVTHGQHIRPCKHILALELALEK